MYKGGFANLLPCVTKYTVGWGTYRDCKHKQSVASNKQTSQINNPIKGFSFSNEAQGESPQYTIWAHKPNWGQKAQIWPHDFV